jgi:carboxylesterase type B
LEIQELISCFVLLIEHQVKLKRSNQREEEGGAEDCGFLNFFYETTISEYRPVTCYLFMAEPDWVRYGSGSGQTCFYKSKARTDHVI